LLSGTIGHDLLANKRVLEVGSGPGLGGFVASKWAKSVVLTDYQDLVLDLMESNINKYNHHVATCEMFAAKVDWNDVQKDNYYTNIELIAEDGTVAGKLSDQQLDVVIGTDVVYWPTQVEPLMNTLDMFVAQNTGLPIYICYIERHVNTHNLLKQSLTDHNFTFSEFGQEITKTINADSYMYKITK